jgi:hypothetical protein
MFQHLIIELLFKFILQAIYNLTGSYHCRNGEDAKSPSFFGGTEVDPSDLAMSIIASFFSNPEDSN